MSVSRTVSRPHGEARREALLDAALECFAERGLVRTGIEDIRKAAGASPSSVYHLFAGLPELIAALLERTFERRFAFVTAKVVEAHLAWVFANGAEARFMYQALALDLQGGQRENLRATKIELKSAMTARLVQLGVIADSGGADGAIDVVLLGMTHQACRAWLTNQRAVDPAWMKEMLPALAWQIAKRTRPR